MKPIGCLYASIGNASIGFYQSNEEAQPAQFELTAPIDNIQSGPIYRS